MKATHNTKPAMTAARVRKVLQKHGFLMLSDATLPSVSGLVAGEPIKGSWWGHPAGHAIYNISNALLNHPDVLVTRLIGGKVTMLDRRLWAAFFAVATEGAAWQTTKLSAGATKLLAAVKRNGEIRSDAIPSALGLDAKAFAAAARDLERRLLLTSEDVHTERGSHAKILRSWKVWRESLTGDTPAPMSDVAEARAMLETAVQGAMPAASEGVSLPSLPWLKRRP